MDELKLTEVTPEQARLWFEGNREINYRPFDKYKAEMIVKSIANNGWSVTGEPIRFDDSGRMVDGQHRCWAIWKSGKTVQTHVMHNMDPKALLLIDSGMKPRKFVDWLRHNGEKNCLQIQCGLLNVHYYKTGALEKYFANSGRRAWDVREMADLLAKYPAMRASASFSTTTRTLIAEGHAALLHFIASEAGLGSEVESFLTAIARGVELDEDHPARRFRDRMIANKVSKQKLTPKYRCAILIVAWNKYLAGEGSKGLRWREVGPKAEDFPVIDVTT